MITISKPINLKVNHKIVKFKGSRKDLMQFDDPLQLALLALGKEDSFLPHIHADRSVNLGVTKTMEAWVILKGKVEAILYDQFKEELGVVKLRSRDIILTVNGGHNYISKSKFTLVSEFKSGPYDPINDKLRF